MRSNAPSLRPGQCPHPPRQQPPADADAGCRSGWSRCRPAGAPLLLMLWCAGAAAAAAAATSPDSAGLVGISPDNPSLSFRIWDVLPRSPLKPRRRDLHEANLLRQLGEDFDPRWMRTRPHFGPDPPEGARQSALKLAALAARELLPDGLAAEARDQLRAWLVQRATCPVRYAWTDLGPDFWPRWVRRGQCAEEPAPPPPPLQQQQHQAAARNGSVVAGGGGAEAGPRSCSWPPGMRCVPSAAKMLQLLRWHCRTADTAAAEDEPPASRPPGKEKKRKSAQSNSVWAQAPQERKKRRKRYRCQWLKVPYPVPEDCTCAC